MCLNWLNVPSFNKRLIETKKSNFNYNKSKAILKKGTIFIRLFFHNVTAFKRLERFWWPIYRREQHVSLYNIIARGHNFKTSYVFLLKTRDLSIGRLIIRISWVVIKMILLWYIAHWKYAHKWLNHSERSWHVHVFTLWLTHILNFRTSSTHPFLPF